MTNFLHYDHFSTFLLKELDLYTFIPFSVINKIKIAETKHISLCFDRKQTKMHFFLIENKKTVGMMTPDNDDDVSIYLQDGQILSDLIDDKKTHDVPEVTIVITEDIFTNERSYAGLRFAHAYRVRGNKVNVILFGKSIEIALKSKINNENPDKWDNRQIWLEEIHEEGGMIYACQCYCYNHNISQQDLLRYVPITKTEMLVDLMNSTKIHLVF